mgnify:CR=1 FL=1
MNKEKQTLDNTSNGNDFIADVMGSFKLKLQERLVNVKENDTWDDWHDGVKFGREDMLEEIIEMIDKGYLNCP